MTRESQSYTNTRQSKSFIVILVLIILWLLFLTFNNVNASKLSAADIGIRLQDEKVQWREKNGEWQTIASVEELTGVRGETGKDGVKGDKGETGAQGIQGAQGVAGKDGKDGVNGTDGKNGTDGIDGKDGTDGLNGVDGQDGIKGDKGDKGDTGAQGVQGVTGKDGKDGADGINGINGTNGAQGDKGETGAQGIQGAQGVAGKDGREIQIRKTATDIEWQYVGDTSWTSVIAISDLKGAKGDKGDKGETGDQGTQGAQGPQGPANALGIGNVTTGAPAANITGTAPNQLLNLTLPLSPAGGTTNQVLTKNSNSDYDAAWRDTYEMRGVGSPQGVVTASSGTYYTDTAGTTGAWRWLKTTATGNSGWKVVYGDTGWRNVSEYFDTTASATTGKQIYLRRVNDTVMVQFHGTLKRNGQIATAPNDTFAGFRNASRLDSPGVATVNIEVKTTWRAGGVITNDISIYLWNNKHQRCLGYAHRRNRFDQ